MEDYLLQRVQEMEEINSQLDYRISQDTLKLNEVVATNAKFLSLLAHDLRSPFNEIIGALEILHDSFEDLDQTQIDNLVHVAINSATKTLTLLDNLLAWTISQNKEKNFKPVKINIFTVVSEEIENFSTTAAQKRISIQHSVLPELRSTADLQMVKAIFRNLISNAIKYSNLNGEININATEGDQFVEIEVADNGIGISQKTQQKLFKIGEFRSTVGTNNEQGTGMGLIFCKEFVEMHGCTIRCESEPGKGSKFKFTLPRYI